MSLRLLAVANGTANAGHWQFHRFPRSLYDPSTPNRTKTWLADPSVAVRRSATLLLADYPAVATREQLSLLIKDKGLKSIAAALAIKGIQQDSKTLT